MATVTASDLERKIARYREFAPGRSRTDRDWAAGILAVIEEDSSSRLSGLLVEEQRLIRKIVDSARHGGVEPGGVENLAEICREITRVAENYA
jgi:hypothetical protein